MKISNFISGFAFQRILDKQTVTIKVLVLFLYVATNNQNMMLSLQYVIFRNKSDRLFDMIANQALCLIFSLICYR
jgi:hypothetical protein